MFKIFKFKCLQKKHNKQKKKNKQYDNYKIIISWQYDYYKNNKNINKLYFYKNEKL